MPTWAARKKIALTLTLTLTWAMRKKVAWTGWTTLSRSRRAKAPLRALAHRVWASTADGFLALAQRYVAYRPDLDDHR